MAKKTMPKGRSLKKRVALLAAYGAGEKVQKSVGTWTPEQGMAGMRGTVVKTKAFKTLPKQQPLPLKLVKAKPSAQMLSKEATENLRTFRAALEREVKIRYEDAKWKEIRRLAHKYEVGGMPAMDEMSKEEVAALTVKTP